MTIFSKRNAKRLFFAWLLLNLVLLIIFWPLVKQLVRFSPVMLPTFYSSPASVAESYTQDIQHLSKILKYDRSFSPDQRAEFIKHLAAMSESVEDMSAAEFYLGVSKAMAIAENGHTNVSKGPAFRNFNRSGIDAFWFSDGLHIVRAHKSLTALVGARIIEIEGRSVEAINQRLGAYIGGALPWKRLYSQYFLRSPDLMHAAGLAASAELLNIKVLDENGIQRLETLKALPAAKDGAGYARSALSALTAESLPEEGARWNRSLDIASDKVPLYLRSFDDNFLKKKLSNGVYIRASVLFNRNGLSIEDRLAAVLAEAPEGGYDLIAFDLRLSPGGDFGTVSEFAQKVESALNSDGKLYVITGPQTFSAAIVSVALFKRYAPNKTLIVGQPMGDYAQFWAERGMSFRLPNSAYYINYATGYHDWEKGCTNSHQYCFSRNARHDGIEVSLKPDVLLETSYKEYAAGRDIEMEWVMADANVEKAN
jgi:hypothetical protein